MSTARCNITHKVVRALVLTMHRSRSHVVQAGIREFSMSKHNIMGHIKRTWIKSQNATASTQNGSSLEWQAARPGGSSRHEARRWPCRPARTRPGGACRPRAASTPRLAPRLSPPRRHLRRTPRPRPSGPGSRPWPSPRSAWRCAAAATWAPWARSPGHSRSTGRRSASSCPLPPPRQRHLRDYYWPLSAMNVKGLAWGPRTDNAEH